MSNTVSNVHDLIYPTPVPLKEISAIAVAFNLCRERIVKYCQNDVSNEFYPVQILRSNFPEIPSVIYNVVEEYIIKCRSSIIVWLEYHWDEIFCVRRPNQNDILNDFHDFAYDWNGVIHYVHTAKRMMLSERLSEVEKFMIACNYCFENDIERIWPSVSTKINLEEVDFDSCPIFFYWICRLKNEPHKIPVEHNEPVDEMMLDLCASSNWFSLLYFWNRIPSERQFLKAVDLCKINWESMVRYILPKLNQHELDGFIAEKGCDWLYDPYLLCCDAEYVLPMWSFIRNRMDERNFICLIEKLLFEETNNVRPKQRLSRRDETYLSCEVWKAAPNNLRQSAIKSLLTSCTNCEWLERKHVSQEPREMRFLITILLDASIEGRKKFWLKNWSKLITGARVEYLRRIMDKCFENKNEMTNFIQNSMGKYENIHLHFGRLLFNGDFKELNDFLIFCHPDIQTRREFAQKLLWHKLLGEDNILDRGLFSHIPYINLNLLNDFIVEAFEEVDLANAFKNQIVLSHVTGNCLFKCIRGGYFLNAVEFVNTFVSVDETLVRVKEHLFHYVRGHLITGNIYHMKADELEIILTWCLGSKDEVDKFKRTILVDDLFRNMIKFHVDWKDIRRCAVKYPSKFDEFLKWYYTSSKEIEKLKERFSEELKMFSGHD